MSTKHTSGEWLQKDGQIYIQETGKTFAVMTYFDGEDKEQEANAKLIASAPDMLSSLENLIYDCKDIIREYCMADEKPEIYDILCKHLDKAKKAINKATI